jgi:hypothetical protein
MPYFGEVREFATGVLFYQPHPNSPSCGITRMATEQRIWTGDVWASLDEDESREAIRQINYKRAAALHGEDTHDPLAQPGALG